MRAYVRVAVTLCLVVVAVFAGLELWRYYMLTPWTRDAKIRADVVIIAPDVSGWVRELKAHDNQAVKAGDLLMSIDRDRFEAALERPMRSPKPASINCACASRKLHVVRRWGRKRSVPSCAKMPRSLLLLLVVNCVKPGRR